MIVNNSPMKSFPGQAFLTSAAGRRLLWFGFAAIFYLSGQTTTLWLLEPENFAGGMDWFWLALFPILLPLFFVIQRHSGCASGRCQRPDARQKKKPGPHDIIYPRIPMD